MDRQFLESFHGVNAAYAVELYERYCRDPHSVDAATRDFFSTCSPPEDEPLADMGLPDHQLVGAVNLAQAIRSFGHLAARIDPLGTLPPGDPSLTPESHGIDNEDLRRLPASLIWSPLVEQATNAYQAIEALRARYCSTTGFDCAHVHNPEERYWLRLAIEPYAFRDPFHPIDTVALLKRLTQVEAFEQFLHRVFPGKFRFSIEGLDMMVPMLDIMLYSAADIGVRQILLGMAHRGRLNILAHILGKPYAQILAEFKDPVHRVENTTADGTGWLGDVKYHRGTSTELKVGELIGMSICMPHNPSHLEAVNPVLLGMARAAGTRADQSGPPQFDRTVALPILIHGDAAFTGQGVVAETLNFMRLNGYDTGGTIHIIANNQLGFTAEAEESRSTLYASDLAKGFDVPVVHVNADDPIACIEAARMASGYRSRFRKDFVIDLVGYRRHGHNEGDEPGYTQPLLYEKIHNHPTVRRQLADRLVEEQAIPAAEPDAQMKQANRVLQEIYGNLDPEKELVEEEPPLPPRGAARRIKTAVVRERLDPLLQGLTTLPKEFHLHPKLVKSFEKRAHAMDDTDQASIDWATAESLALASILEDGVPIRMTGQDVERGTFSQRHAVFHDRRTGREHVLHQHLPRTQASFEIHNSPLTEASALAFEYGYNVQEPARLVIWEAQYGDFINNAQTVVDEFICTGRTKWGVTPSLVLLLPHGWEGAGPDHSSSHLERFLRMAADINLRVAYPTTAAQYFHLLRRQALLLKTDPLPLVILTPKSLLRNPMVSSTPRSLSDGCWEPILDDPVAANRADRVRRVVLCSGKIFVDLAASEHRSGGEQVALVRIEQLYPFLEDAFMTVVERYHAAEEFVWIQEEPANMGAWDFLRPWIEKCVQGRGGLRFVGRAASSSPAEGSATRHAAIQKALVDQAFAMQGRVENQELTK